VKPACVEAAEAPAKSQPKDKHKDQSAKEKARETGQRREGLGEEDKPKSKGDEGGGRMRDGERGAVKDGKEGASARDSARSSDLISGSKGKKSDKAETPLHPPNKDSKRQSPVDDSHASDHARDKRLAPPSSRTDPKSEFAEELFYDALKRTLGQNKLPFGTVLIHDQMKRMENKFSVHSTRHSTFASMCRYFEEKGDIVLEQGSQETLVVASHLLEGVLREQLFQRMQNAPKHRNGRSAFLPQGNSPPASDRWQPGDSDRPLFEDEAIVFEQ